MGRKLAGWLAGGAGRAQRRDGATWTCCKAALGASAHACAFPPRPLPVGPLSRLDLSLHWLHSRVSPCEAQNNPANWHSIRFVSFRCPGQRVEQADAKKLQRSKKILSNKASEELCSNDKTRQDSLLVQFSGEF